MPSTRKSRSARQTESVLYTSRLMYSHQLGEYIASAEAAEPPARQVFIGIDPGKSGGIACRFYGTTQPHPRLITCKMTDDPWGIANNLIRSIRGASEYLIVVEAVHSSPQMGVTSAFTFGRNFGTLQGILVGLGLKYYLVSPQKWQRRFEAPTRKEAGERGHKAFLKEAAQSIVRHVFARSDKSLPAVYNWNADAILIAEYARLNASKPCESRRRAAGIRSVFRNPLPASAGRPLPSEMP